MHVALYEGAVDGPLQLATRILIGAGTDVPLIAGAPGMGKTSILAAAAEEAAESARHALVWVAGSAVASEGHLARLLWDYIPDSDGQSDQSDLALALDRLTQHTAVLLAVDDLDVLTYKRERTAELIGRWARKRSCRLAGSCSASSVARLTHYGTPLVSALGRSPVVVPIDLLDEEAASALVQRRAPSLNRSQVEAVVRAAAGHPAALVFLSRIVSLEAKTYRPDEGEQPDEAVLKAAEFAGAAYAEPWASLGPQQRAILWQLARHSPATAAEIARALALPASHISAQLTRLVADALVQRLAGRGGYAVAPLLAEWISRRAARGLPRQHFSRREA
jgi:hypothetical protein